MRNPFQSSIIWVTILISFLIGIWLENDSGTFYESYVSPLLNFKIPLILVLVLAAASYQFHTTKINHYEGLITDFEGQIRDGSRALWKYFKDISELKVREIVQDVMVAFTKKHSHVLAVQIYEYSIKHLKKHTLFIVTHKYSSVSESTDINALLQTYYRIPKELYDEYIRARTVLSQTILLEDDITFVNGLCIKYITEIAEKDVKKLTEEDAIIYGLVEVILDSLSFRLNSVFSHSLNEEVLFELNNLKRTGILKGIEMKRKYLTQTINDPELLDGRPHIILITLNPDYLPVDEEAHEEGVEWQVRI